MPKKMNRHLEGDVFTIPGLICVMLFRYIGVVGVGPVSIKMCVWSADQLEFYNQ